MDEAKATRQAKTGIPSAIIAMRFHRMKYPREYTMRQPKHLRKINRIYYEGLQNEFALVRIFSRMQISKS